MSYIGNPPVVQSSRLVYEETAATAKTAFTPPGGYTVGQLEVYINGAQLMSDDFTATDGSTVNLTTACAIGDGFKSIAYGNFLTTNALNKTGDTMTGPLTLGGLLNTGATGQIKFPAAQNASADANTLDDYEEGTWTPTFGGNTTAGSATYSQQTGKYTKVGRLVTASFDMIASSTLSGAVGVLSVLGLPFPSVSSPYLDGGSGSNGYYSGWSGGGVYSMLSYIDGNSTKIILTWGSGGTATAYAALTAVQNGTRLAGTISYLTST